jgi:hypothetical protein
MQQTSNTVKLSDLLAIAGSFIKFLFSNLKLFFILVVLAAGLGSLYYISQKPKYLAVTTFILEEKSSSAGNLAGIASQFGFDIGGISGGSGIFAGDNILDILKSRTIVEKVLLSKIDTTKGANGLTLADLYLDASQLKQSWKNKENGLATISFTNCVPDKPNSLLQDSVLFVIYTKLLKKNLSAERLNKKGSIIRLATESGNQVFSKCLTERLLTEVRTLYINLKTSNSQQNVTRLEKRADSLLSLLNSKSYQSASLQIVDVNPVYKSSVVPVELSQRDKSVISAVYAEIVKNLEMSRMLLAQQTPVIQVLDVPKYPLDDQERTFLRILLISLLAAFGVGLLICLFLYRS